jgi:hypothetical protein
MTPSSSAGRASFPDETVATAILDRVLHHCPVVRLQRILLATRGPEGIVIPTPIGPNTAPASVSAAPPSRCTLPAEAGLDPPDRRAAGGETLQPRPVIWRSVAECCSSTISALARTPLTRRRTPAAPVRWRPDETGRVPEPRPRNDGTTLGGRSGRVRVRYSCDRSAPARASDSGTERTRGTSTSGLVLRLESPRRGTSAVDARHGSMTSRRRLAARRSRLASFVTARAGVDGASGSACR